MTTSPTARFYFQFARDRTEYSRKVVASNKIIGVGNGLA